MDIPIEPTTTEAYIAAANILRGMKGVWGVASSEEDAVPSEPYRIMDFIIQTVGGAATTNTPTYPFFPDWFRFQELISQWRRERGATSSITKMAMCPSYQRIIAMGERAIPLILRQMQDEGDEPDMWFWALRVLTDADPVPDHARGDISAMARAWLRWARFRYDW